MKFTIEFDDGFEQDVLALFKKMIEENTSVEKLPPPFDSLSVIITDNEPKAYLMAFKEEKSGKKGYVVSKGLSKIK